MQQHEFLQGSPEWHAHRATCFNASDAPAMLGCSPYQTRTDLLHQLHTGITPEHDAATEQRFADGHRYEALARPLAEEIIGQELYPVSGSAGCGLARPLGASFDGITMEEDIVFEHKSLNADLRAVLSGDFDPDIVGDLLPKQYRAQMEQQLLVSGAERVLFMASKWNGETLVEERHCWYDPNPTLRAEIIAGWKQFGDDLAAYVPPPASAPAPVAKAAASLPIVFDMRVEGKLVSCNLEQYKPAALAYIEAINTELTTDQHFADATSDAKFCRDSADKLELAIELALGQMGDINTALNTVREIAAAFDAKGLALEKLVESQKKTIKEAQVLRGQQALKAHVDALNVRLGKAYMPTIPADFAGKIKGLRTVDSLRNAIDTELARAKIEASRIADAIQVNLNWLREHGKDYTALFPDTGTIVLKAHDDLVNLATKRIDDHKAAEAQRLEAERERIRKEEADKLQREQAALQPTPAPTSAPQVAAPAAPPAAASPKVFSFSGGGGPRSAPPAAPTLRIGQINERLDPIQLSAQGLATLGFEGTKDRGAVLYHESDFPRICEALIAHVQSVAQPLAA
jgi:putative phage-type endonuclease